MVRPLITTAEIRQLIPRSRLVATIGPRSNTRKITRKAIQGVNIPRACDTIIQPGAPIALRLQGSLLYGVSRVYSQQCTYMLTDVEKVQSHMQTFFHVWGTSSIDPQAGKAK
jgi:meiotic recombination protein REC8